MNKIDLFNAKNAGVKVEKGMEINVTDVGTFEDVDKDGHNVTVTALKSEDGTIYTTISNTIANSVDMLEDIIADNEGKPVTVRVLQKKSNNNREFYQLSIMQ